MGDIYRGKIPFPRPTDKLTVKGEIITDPWYNIFNDIYRRTGGVINGVLSNNLLTETSSAITLVTGATFNITDVGGLYIGGVQVTGTASELNFLDGTTMSNGGIAYSTGSIIQILPGTATANQIILSGSNTTPAWSTATYPATTTVNQILYSSSANTIAGITTGNDGVLITSGTGVPSISSTLPSIVTGNITSVGTISSGVWNGTVISMTYGGTSKALTADNGGIVYTDADSMEVLAATATANQVLLSGSNVAPAWSTATYPATTTTNQILYSSSDNVIAEITTGNDGALITSAGGIPSISSTLPATVQGNITSVGTITSGVWEGTTVGVDQGGTGQTSYTNGQLLIGNTTGNTLTKATLTAGTSMSITNGTGSISLNTIQGIRTTDSPTFAKLTLSGDVAQGFVLSGTRTVVSGLQIGIYTNTTYNPVSNSNVVGIYNTCVIGETNAAVSTTSVQACRNEVSYPNANVGSTSTAYAQYNRCILGTTTTGTIGTFYGVAYVINGTADPGNTTSAYSFHMPKPDFGTNKYCGYLEGPVGFNNAAPTETIHNSGSFVPGKRTATATDYTVVALDYLIAVTSTAAARTITLPAAASVAPMREFVVVDESGGAGTNNIILSPASGNINGAASISITTNYGAYTVYSNGTNYFVK